MATRSEEGYSFDDLIGLLVECGYSARKVSSGKPLPLDAARLREVIPDGAGLNVILD